MIKVNKFIKIVALSFVLGACSSNPKKQISDELFTVLKKSCQHEAKKNVVVYYFNGDCSFCIAQVIELEERFGKNQDTMVINIAKTKNPAYLRFQMKESKIMPCMVLTTDSTHNDTLIRNQFEFDKMYLIDGNKNIEPFKLN